MPLVQMPFPHLFTLAARNLIENAVLHSPPDGCVRCGFTVADNRLTLTVEDSGPGIPDIEMPHVTERFFRGKHRQDNGSGLGLAIVQMAVTRMEGTFDLVNRPDGGLRASMTIPVT